MADLAQFTSTMQEAYQFKGPSLVLGGAMINGEAVEGLQVTAPLSMFNRHGLIAGATGTGKTKTLQGLAESLSIAGVPVLLMDIKGDLSGLAASGNPHPKIEDRHRKIGLDWQAKSFPVEMLSLSDEKGIKLRATISEFGPVLLSRILGLNDTQQGAVAIAFKYCDDYAMPLLDIKDFRKVLQHISNEAREEVKEKYGYVSTSSIGSIMRKLLELEQQGGDRFFGEPSTDVFDLARINDSGEGYINIIRLVDMQTKPNLFSTFMLCLLAEIYEKFPEQGDADRPELVIFIDEAHLIFDHATKALLDQLENIIKLIRSKGVGIFFCTQVPADVPEAILSQLGMKIQHSMRAFTAKDRTNIKRVAENYPITGFYETDQLLTQMGIGEAMVSLLNEKGIPTPLVHALLCAPRSRMDILTPEEIDRLVSNSALADKYNREIDRESAYEILNKKLVQAAEEEKNLPTEKYALNNSTTLDKILKSSVTRTVVRELTRGLLGVLGIGPQRRSTRRR